MQIISPASISKKRQLFTALLTIIGMMLFLFGGSKAISQSSDKRYVEGLPRQQRVGSFGDFARGRVPDGGAPHGLAGSVETVTVHPAETPQNDNGRARNGKTDPKPHGDEPKSLSAEKRKKSSDTR